MKVTVNITPDGILQANPEMLVMPEEPEYKTWKTTDDERRKNARQIIEHREMVDRWHSGLVDFEDKERVLWILFQGGKVETDKPFSSNPNEVMDGIKRILKPGTYTVELPEFGVVKQCRNEDYDEWKDDKKFFSNYPFSTRRVLRFKV